VAETAISALAAALPALQLLLMRDALAAGLAPNKPRCFFWGGNAGMNWLRLMWISWGW
jgi:hypothetical protein